MNGRRILSAIVLDFVWIFVFIVFFPGALSEFRVILVISLWLAAAVLMIIIIMLDDSDLVIFLAIGMFILYIAILLTVWILFPSQCRESISITLITILGILPIFGVLTDYNLSSFREVFSSVSMITNIFISVFIVSDTPTDWINFAFVLPMLITFSIVLITERNEDAEVITTLSSIAMLIFSIG